MTILTPKQDTILLICNLPLLAIASYIFSTEGYYFLGFLDALLCVWGIITLIKRYDKK